MIWQDSFFSKEVADYLNSHPAFNHDMGSGIINPPFFDKYIGSIMDVTEDVPIVMDYKKAVYRVKEFTLDKAKEFIKWLDPYWTEYRGLKRSEFFKDDGLYEVTEEFEDI
ncbi:MAG: hypothetical protein J6T10_16755 [Methanobrevibacter sp.]|nr:hypothetical protein [Methanobrevibacter sp.]